MKSLSLVQPHALIMVGVPGAGKSHFAEKFSETFKAPRVSTNDLLSVIDDLHAAEAIALKQLVELTKTSSSIIVDGLSDTRSSRAELAKLVRKAGYQPLIVWVQTDPATAKFRSTKKNAGSSRTPLDEKEHDKRVNRFTPPSAQEKPVVISGKHTYPSQAKVVLKHLSSPRAEITTHQSPALRTSERGGRRSITIR